MTSVFFSSFRLVNHSMGDPRALLSSYSTAESMVGSTGDEAKEKLIVLVLETVERLFSAFHQVYTKYILKKKIIL